MGTAAASAGAAGPPEGLRAGRSSGRTKPEYTAASGPRDYGSGPTTGTRSQTTCYVRRGTGRVLYYLTPAHSFLCDADLSEVSRRHVRKTSVFFLVTIFPKKVVTGLIRIIKRASSCRA